MYPGETALAFFTAKNRTDRPITGIATYTVLPYEAALYFNKIQCFCFEEQRLNAQEEIDMPVNMRNPLPLPNTFGKYFTNISTAIGFLLRRSGVFGGSSTREGQHNHFVLYVLRGEAGLRIANAKIC